MNPVVLRPETLQEALTLLDADEDALIYGGGTALQILRKQGILFASSFVDISRLPGMAELEERSGTLHVGAMVPLRRMERDPLVIRDAPLAASAYAKVANPRVRNSASVGGNIAHGDYRLDPPVALLVLGASVEITSAQGTRTVPIDHFFVDFQTTALEHGDMVTAIDIPVASRPASSCYIKLSSLSANDWPCATAAVSLVDEGSRRILRLALGALAPTPVLAVHDITGLNRKQLLEVAVEIATTMMDPIPDVRGGVEYKRKLGRVAVEEAVAGAWKEQTDA